MKEITNIRRFELLSKAYLYQTEIAQVLNRSTGLVSKALKNNTKILKHPFGLGYKTKDVITFFEIDFKQICELAIIESKIKGESNDTNKN